MLDFLVTCAGVSSWTAGFPSLLYFMGFEIKIYFKNSDLNERCIYFIYFVLCFRLYKTKYIKIVIWGYFCLSLRACQRTQMSAACGRLWTNIRWPSSTRLQLPSGRWWSMATIQWRSESFVNISFITNLSFIFFNLFLFMLVSNVHQNLKYPLPPLNPMHLMSLMQMKS